MSTASGLGLRFLGDVEVSRGGVPLELPPSRKTRALLAYLALTGRAHRREKLCGLLWDVADDPRGALRWSLSRLRSVLDEPGATRLRAERDSVAFDPQGAWIDVATARARVRGGLASVTLDELRSLAELFRGELLEGLDLDDFGDFQAWCVAEREEARRLHAEVLRALVERLRAAPDDALPYAKTLAGVDPLDGASRAELVRLLLQAGRRPEAEQSCAAARRLLREMGRDDEARTVEEAWQRGRVAPARAPAAPPEREPAPEARWSDAPATLHGRRRELSWLAAALAAAAAPAGARVLLLAGEPGIGKSRLLAEFAARARAEGATVLEGRSFEAEAERPYGAWREALRSLPPAGLGSRAGDLAPLLAGRTDDARATSRDGLFAAVADLVASRAEDGRAAVLAFDDLQWLDAASAELLHYVARTSRGQPLLVALSARPGELPDNDAALRLVRGLRQLGLLEQRTLEPLSADDTAALVRSVAPGADAGRVFAESAGNPLFALELARSIALGEEPLPGSLADVIRQRLERLPADAAEVLRWAAVAGRGFDLERLRPLVDLGLERLLPALERLERHGLLRSDPQREGGCAFTHEVVRRAVYGELSGPRRRLMHLRVARALEQAAAPADAAALAYHAALAGETALAARSCLVAARRNLEVFATEAALTLARRGRRHAEALPEPERTEQLLELLQVELAARRPAEPAAVAREVEALAERALDAGRPDHARLGYHLLAWLRWDQGDWTDARRQALRAEAVSRAGSEKEQVTAMAEAARCLALLERDLTHAEALALEARARSERTGVRISAIADAQGMLRLHEGRDDEAAALFEQARGQARREGDRMAEFHALEHLVVVHQQSGDWDGAWRYCGDLVALGEKLRGGSEAPFSRALWALTRLAQGHPAAAAPLDAAIEELRAADAKHRLAYALTRAAALDLARGETALARVRAEEAMRAAGALGRPTEAILAAVTLARVCLDQGDRETAARLVRELQGRPATGAAAVARVAVRELLQAATP